MVFWSLFFQILKRSKYLLANSNDESFPRTKEAVFRSLVTNSSICHDQICRDQIW